MSYKEYRVSESLVTTGREMEASTVSLKSFAALEFKLRNAFSLEVRSLLSLPGKAGRKAKPSFC